MLDPYKFANIAFQGRRFLGPYASESIVDMIGGIKGEVLDIGCGNGSVMEATNAIGVGIDRNPSMIEEARLRNPDCRFYDEDAKSILPTLNLNPDIIICLGASQAIGMPNEALSYFCNMLRPGGYLLFGDGIWDAEPSQHYLDFLGMRKEDSVSFDEFQNFGQAFGLAPVKSYRSTSQDWDSFEDHYYHTMIKWCEENPADPDEPAFRTRMTAWRDAYLSYGRGTLGYAIVLYQKEPLLPN